MKISYIIVIKTPGLWGTGKKGLEADNLTYKCRIGEVEVPCIPSTSIKGALRKTASQLLPILKQIGAVKDPNIIKEVFGDRGTSYTPLTLTDAIPLSSTDIAKEAFKKGIHILINNILKIPTMTVPHVRIDDKSLTAAKRALFTEERIPVETSLYGEIHIYEKLLGEDKALEAMRLILFSLSDLRYRYLGRKSLIDIKIIGIEPSNLLEDKYISFIYNNLSLR